MLIMRTMSVTNNASNANDNANANTNTSAPLAEEEEEESDCMSMCSEEDEEESEDEDGEELDAASVYVSLFAVADRMERWYASGAREYPEDHVMRVEAWPHSRRRRHRGRALPPAGGAAGGGEGAPARGAAQPGHD